jgi:hypothetical protein
MTSASFKRMKSQSKETMDRLSHLTSYDAGVKKGSMYKTRIGKSILGYSYFDNMRECDDGNGNACFSVFCNHCRKVKQDKMYGNYWDHFEGKYGRSEKKIRANARFGTVLHSLVPVNVATDGLEQETIDLVFAATKDLKETLLKIDRKAKNKFRADIWIAGSIHIELIDYDRWMFASLSGHMTAKQKTYNEFIKRSSNNAGGHYFLVHTHFLCDTDGMVDDDFNELFKEHSNQTSRQVLIKRLTDTYETGMGDVKHELDTAFRNIANYCYTGSNHGLAYAKNWGNSGKVVDTKVDAKGEIRAFAKEVFDVDIEDELSVGHLRLLIQVHNELTNGNKQGLRVQVR